MRAKPNQRINVNVAKVGIHNEVELGARDLLASATNEELLHLSSQAIGIGNDDLPSEPNDRVNPIRRGGPKADNKDRKYQMLNDLGNSVGRGLTG